MSRLFLSRTRWLVVLTIALVAAMPAAGALASPVIHVSQAELKARGAAGLASLAHASAAVYGSGSAAEQITGTVHLPGAYAGDSQVNAVAYQWLIDPSGLTSVYGWTVVSDAQVATTGAYAVDLPGPGTYRVGFTDSVGVYADSYFANASKVESATSLVVATSTPVANIDQTLTAAPEYIVSGQIRFLGAASASSPTNIDVYTWDSATTAWVAGPSHLSNDDGSYRLHLPSATNYRFGFSDPNGVFADVFYSSAAMVGDGTTVPIVGTGVTPGVDVTMTALSSGRIAGADSYGTAAKWSADQYVDGVGGTVTLASRTALGDCLAGSTYSLAQGGPLLLTSHTTLPAATIAEIRRINPMTVVIVGGSNNVSLKQEAQLRRLGVPIVRRIAGADVFETAADVAQELLNTGLAGGNGIAVANADLLADGVAGASVAAADGRPILFVRRNSIPAATQEFIDSNSPASTLVFAGSGVVSSMVRSRLPGVVPLNGRNTWEMSAAIARYGIDTLGLNGRIVNLATSDGANLAESVAAASIAGARRQVELVTPRTVLRWAVGDFLRSRAGTIARITVVGGTSSVSEPVFTAAKQAILAP